MSMIDVLPLKGTRITLPSLRHQRSIPRPQLLHSFPYRLHSPLLSDHRHGSTRSLVLTRQEAAVYGTSEKRDDPVYAAVPMTKPTLQYIRVLLRAAFMVAVWSCLLWIHPRLAMAQGTSSGFSIVNAFREHGAATYALLFGIVFCETGLVVTPFLPGDSLLFAAGALAGFGKLNILYLSAIFNIAAILGDAVNYALGSFLGQKAVDANLVPKTSIEKTKAFFEKYGGKTIVIARFVPIVRTFAPFVAGISKMEYRRFAAFNIGGALLWTALLCGAGYFFGNLPFVEKNFTLVIVAVVVISILPIVYEIIAARQESKTSSDPTTQE